MPRLFLRRNIVKYRSLIFIAILSALLAQPLHAAIPAQPMDGGEAAKQPHDKKAAEHYYQEGLKFLVEGKLKMAKKAYLVSLKNSPDYPNSMLGLAEVAFKENNLKEAENWINYAAEKAPDNPHVLASHGRLAYLNGNYLAAEADFLKALRIDPKMTSTGMALGDLYFGALKRPRSAVRAYNKVIELEPEHAGAHYALGMALFATNRAEKAEHELLTASKLAPDNPLPYFTLGNIAASKNKPDKALAYYDKVLSLDPTNIKTLSRRGDIYRSLNKDKLAIRDYEAALAIDSKQPAINMSLGMLQQKHGEYEKAKNAYLSVIDHAPDAVLAYNNLAWMAAEKSSDLDLAVEWANKAARLAPESSEVFDTLGWVYRAKKDHNSATSAFKRATLLNPESATAFYHLGLSYMDQQDKTQAANAFNRAMQLGANSQLAKLAKESLNKLNN